MISGRQVFDRKRCWSTQTLGKHQHLIVNLVVTDHLLLWIVCRVLFHQIDFVAVDAAVVIDGFEKDFNAFGEWHANRRGHWPRKRGQDTKTDGFTTDANTSLGTAAAASAG